MTFGRAFGEEAEDYESSSICLSVASSSDSSPGFRDSPPLVIRQSRPYGRVALHALQFLQDSHHDPHNNSDGLRPVKTVWEIEDLLKLID
jgi:hypothetical protein